MVLQTPYSESVFKFQFIFLAIIHALESVVAIGFCMWGSLPLWAVFANVLAVLFLGIFQLKYTVRAAVFNTKRQMHGLTFS
jgi:hypothetical protein